MAKAKKLPSGSWRCLVYDYTDENGKRKYRSFTSDDPTSAGKREAEFLAAQFAADKETASRSDLTFEEALSAYIKDREAVLAPSTIREYKRSQKRDFESINKKKIRDLTQENIQNFINEKAEKVTPKTVRNIHGLLAAALKAYRPELILHTALPQKIQPSLYIPTDDDIQVLLKHVNDDDMMIAILLAAFGPLRRSEICGLEDTDIKDKIIHVQRAVVLDENKNWVDKTTKSVAGDRFIPLPDFVWEKIKDRKGRIIHLKPSQISDRFIDIQNASGLPHFRFHDLRHYCASIQHALGIPDAYIMQRGGWGSDAVLKQVYRHALADKSTQMNDIANKHFSGLCNTECNTN